MPDHIYSVDLSTTNFSIRISPTTEYGYFEHNKLGDNCGGGLWFEGKKLVDADGTFCVPMEVGLALRAAGYEVEDDFLPDEVKK